MKKFYVLLLCLITAFSIYAQQSVNVDKEKQAIRKTALDYVEGWFTGNAERMDQALHQDLVKRAIAADRETGEIGVRYPATKEQMVEWTSKRQKETRPEEEWNIKVEIFDVLKHSASVKISSCDYIDYAHMVKVDGEWKILNVMWEFPEKK